MKASMMLFGLVGTLSACSNTSSTTSSGSGTGGAATTATTSATSGTASTQSATTSTATQTSASTTAMSSTSTGIPTVNLSATILDEATQAPIAGAKVCAYLHPELPCTTSDATGKFTEGLPENANTGVLIDKTGYGGVMAPITTQTFPFTGLTIEMATTAQLTAYYGGGNSTYPESGKGFLKVSFASSGAMQGGSTATLVPAGGKGPFYAGPTGTYDPAAGLTGTSSAGSVRWGSIPANASMEADAQCGNGVAVQGQFGWANASTSKLGLPIVDGYETHVDFQCSNNG